MRTLRPAHAALFIPWVVVVVAARLPVRDNSFLWHVRAGTAQLDGGHVLTTDPFSFTFAGADWRTQSWLIELGYGWLERRVGLVFVPWLIASVGVATLGLVAIAVFRLTHSVEATALIGVASAWLAAAFLNPRPVLISYALMAAVVAVSTDRRLRWTLPLLGWMWGSVHGSFILGIGYLVLDGLRQRRRSAALDAVAMSAAATAGAHGLGVWEILGEFVGSREALRLITEWATPNFTAVANLPFLAGLLLIIYASMRSRLRREDLWVMAPFLGFGMAASRSVLPAWIALAPLAGRGFAGLPVGTRPGRSRLPIPIASVVILAFPFLIPVSGDRMDERFPVEAAEHLTNQRVFHDDVVGGYLMYAQWPERSVFVDDRAELFGVDHLKDTLETRNGTPIWVAVFDKWSIDQAIVRQTDGLVAALASAGWTERYRDEGFVILDRP